MYPLNSSKMKTLKVPQKPKSLSPKPPSMDADASKGWFLDTGLSNSINLVNFRFLQNQIFKFVKSQ
jgi:hypothetical protein